MVYTKLVRDAIPEVVEHSTGRRPEYWQEQSDEKFRTALLAKLLEECQEVATAMTGAAVVQELADVLEVLLSIAELEGFPPEALEAARISKAERLGSFTRRVVMIIEEQN